MNNKEFLSQYSKNTGEAVRDAQQTSDEIVGIITQLLEDGDTIVVPGFGTLEVRKKMERVVGNPTTHQKMLVPPKLVVNFKSAPNFKERMQ